MGQWTIVIHGTGAHHNWATTPDHSKPAASGHEFITGRKNNYDADLMFAEFVDQLKAKGHTITGSTFTHGGMEGADSVIRRDYVNPHLPPRPKAPFRPTALELTWGSDHHSERKRYFSADHQSDAIVRMAEAVLMLDRDDAVGGGYVHLRRMPDSVFPKGQHLAAWTKTSNERPTAEGAASPEELG